MMLRSKIVLFFWLILCLAPVYGQDLSRYESIPQHEALITQALLKNIREKIEADKLGVRDAHPKAHGCVSDAKVTVLDAGDPDLQKGLFAQVGTEYTAIMRFSSGSSNPHASDLKGGSQGLAVKILLPEIEQERVADIPGEQYFVDKKFYKTFDVIGITGLHEFPVSTVADYPEFFKGVAAAEAAAVQAARAGASDAEIAAASGKALDDTYLHLNGQEGKVRPREALLMKQLSALKTFDPTADSYQSWVPSLLGDAAVKYQIRPCEEKNPLDDSIVKELGLTTNPNFLGHVLKHRLKESSVCFIVGVQKHLNGFPSIEDAVAPWPRDQSPYKAIARITTHKSTDNVLLDKDFCNKLSFSPAHATPEHRPIGGIQRSRALIYAGIETARNLITEQQDGQ